MKQGKRFFNFLVWVERILWSFNVREEVWYIEVTMGDQE